MRLEWLEDILAVAETGSFSEAAVRRRLTQSAFSRRIRHIEDHLGVVLFDRSRKPVQLCLNLADRREQIARLAGQLRQLSEDLRHGDRISGNRIVLASQHALTTSLAPGVVRRMGEAHENIHIHLRSADLDDCYALLLSRRADIALVYFVADEGIAAQPDYIETVVIGTDRLIPVCGATMASATEWMDAKPLPLIAYPNEVFLGQVMERTVLPEVRSRRPIEPRVETALTLAALEFASEGIGVAWVPASLARVGFEVGRITDLSAHLPSCLLGVAAVRVRGHLTAAEIAVWETLSTPKIMRSASRV